MKYVRLSRNKAVVSESSLGRFSVFLGSQISITMNIVLIKCKVYDICEIVKE